MEAARIKQMLHFFKPNKKIADIDLRGKGFSNSEIKQVEDNKHIICLETTAWGDRRFVITDKGIAFIKV